MLINLINLRSKERSTYMFDYYYSYTRDFRTMPGIEIDLDGQNWHQMRLYQVLLMAILKKISGLAQF